MSKICANCGAQLSDEDNFCASCGTKSEAIAETNAEPVVETTPEPITEPVPEEALEPTVEAITEPVAEETPSAEPVAEPQPESVEQGGTKTTEPPAADDKNLYNTPRSTDPSPFVAYTPNNTKTPEPVPSNTTYAETTFNQEPAKKSGKGLLIAILIIILVLLVGAGILIYFLFFSSGNYKEAIEAYYEAQEDLEFEDFRKATGDTALIAIVEEKNGSDIQTFKLGCQRMQQVYNVTNIDLEVEYEILDVQKMSKDDLEEFDDDTLVAEEGYEVDVSYTVEDESTGEKEENSETLSVVKFDGDWCVTNIIDAIDEVIDIGEFSDDEFETALEYYKDN